MTVLPGLTLYLAVPSTIFFVLAFVDRVDEATVADDTVPEARGLARQVTRTRR